jgi:hypothetical protein
MPADASFVEPAVGGDHRTIMFESEREVDAIPKRHLIVERQIQCVS